jgi:sigma-B regulation protein RsbU (phosphoserine phosphatase)
VSEAGAEQLRKLTEIGRAFTYTTSLDQVADLTVERAAALLDGSGALLMLANADGQFKVRATHGVDAQRIAPFEAPLTGDVFGSLGELLGVPDDSFLAVPLVVGGAVTGILAVALRQPLTSTDEWLLSALADQAAVALENARLSGEVLTQMESRLRASEGSTNAKDRALNTLAHDIRTPLGAIDGYCEIMQEEVYGPINDWQRDALARVRMSGRHLLSLLDSVMDMARLNAGVGHLSTTPIPLAEVAREAVDMVIPASLAKLQHLDLVVQDTVVAMGDRARTRQVLVNLLSNAVKFTEGSGSIRVTISTRYVGGVPRGEIAVSDSGPGIAAAEQSAVFEPYYRSEGSAAIPGVGLGLAISKALINQMHGELVLESTVGKGSTFSIRLPLLATA